MFIAKLPGVSGVFRIMLLAVMLAVSAGCQNRLIALDGVKAGDVITFGRYPQTESGGIKPIEWRVLEVKGNMALLLADKGLDSIPYNLKYADVTWETSHIRWWLNMYFLNTAFTNSEQYSIAVTVLKNPDNLKYGTKGGYDTSDRIFLLSLDEAERYFMRDADRVLKPTPYTVKRGAWVSKRSQSTWWWLRSPGDAPYEAALVYADGMLLPDGRTVSFTFIPVRPALWVRFEPSNQ